MLLHYKSYTDPYTLRVGNFNSQHSPKDRPSRHNLHGEMLDQTGIISQIALTDIYGTFHPNTKEYTFSQHVMELSSKLTTYKASLKRKKETKTTPCIFSDNHELKLDSNNRKKTRKLTDSWKLSNSLCTKSRSKQKVRKKSKTF